VHKHGFQLFGDFVAEIEKLQDARIAVVSSGSQNYVLPALQKTNLNPTHILAFEDHHSKEEKIELVCRDWGIDVSEAYYFTDTLADIYELRDMIAPDKLIAVSWGYCTKEQLLTELPEENILSKPSDLTKVIR
jgi:phosphoglycolate phosphatase-like HAD superfamily hydrolase